MEQQIIGAEFADRYGQRSMRMERYRPAPEPCPVCQHPTMDCATHPAPPPDQVYEPVNAEPPPRFDNPPGCPKDGPCLRADEPFTPTGALPTPLYAEVLVPGTRKPSYVLVSAPGAAPDLRFHQRRNAVIATRAEVPG